MHRSSEVLVVCGTRPEAVKLAPVIKGLRSCGVPISIVLTGQHPDMAPVFLREFGLEADMDLGAMARSAGKPVAGATVDQLLGHFVPALGDVLAQAVAAGNAYKLVLVQGDTVSALAGALAGSYARVAVAHVEAGLRSYDHYEPHPEEIHRELIARLASLHFAPTNRAAQALMQEGVAACDIYITGNSGIDNLLENWTALRQDFVAQTAMRVRFPFAAQARKPLLLATMHRRENLGPRLQVIASALARIAAFSQAEIIIPMHPNPAVRSILEARLRNLSGVHLIEPVSYREMIWLMQKAHLLLTDSGGLQEEAPYLGLRTLVLRKTTERPEAIELGAAELVPLRTEAIVHHAQAAMAKPRLSPVAPFGDGQSGTRIAKAIRMMLARPDFVAPARVGKAVVHAG